MAQKKEDLTPKKEDLTPILKRYEKKYRQSAQLWRGGYRALLVLSALFSATAAVIGQFNHWKFDFGHDLGAIFAGAAAVITTLIAALNFDSNMRINRKSRHDVEAIQLDLEKDTFNKDEIIERLQNVIKTRSEDLE